LIARLLARLLSAARLTIRTVDPMINPKQTVFRIQSIAAPAGPV
jgi:hypothetical protein